MFESVGRIVSRIKALLSSSLDTKQSVTVNTYSTGVCVWGGVRKCLGTHQEDSRGGRSHDTWFSKKEPGTVELHKFPNSRHDVKSVHVLVPRVPAQIRGGAQVGTSSRSMGQRSEVRLVSGQ